MVPGRARTDLIAPLEPATRAFGLPIGVARTGRSLVGMVADKLSGTGSHEQRGGSDVEADRRAA
jgi:hypothetical protein